MLTAKIFKAYDVRGVYGVDWDAAGAGLVARAFVEEFKLKTVCVGWDMRESCGPMVAEIVAACTAAGVNVVRVGRVTTPMLYAAAAHYGEHDGGIMVTASHNTGEWNGMKLLLSDGMPVGEASGLPAIKERALAGNFLDATLAGTARDLDIRETYFQKIFSLVNLDPTKKISTVIDCGNGMAGETVHEFLQKIPMVSAEVLYDTPDGSFPSHEANPLKEETLAELKRQVVARGAALGIAFDGDADRVGFVDETGVVISGDVMIGLVGVELLRAWPETTILYDLRSRRAVARAIAAAGGVPVMSRVGHAFIKKQLRETGALFAGELSSHFYFKDFFGVECADLMVLLVLKILQEYGEPLSKIVAPFLVDAHSGEINFTVTDRDGVIARLREHFSVRAKEVSGLDGLLFDMGDWWFNIRPSNTEPILRLNAEAATRAELDEHLAEIRGIIEL